MDLNKTRERIDSIDSELIKLFKDRMDAVCDVARYKKENGLPIYNGQREREVINKVVAELPEELALYAKVLYNTLFSVSRGYQTKMIDGTSQIVDKIKKALESTDNMMPLSAVVACQGTEGAYSQKACEKLFANPSVMYFDTFKGVLDAVSMGMCRYGILPVENSTSGTICQVYDLMLDHKFYIVRSCLLPVQHSLLLAPGAKISDVREVISHEQGLKQCAAYLKNLGDLKLSTAGSTALAAKKVSESGRKDVAAIASKECAAIYSLNIAAENIQDRDSNYTRFICISRKPEIYPASAKISIMGSLSHKPGALCQLLSRFAALGINLSKIESRPCKHENFEYMFYFDFEASLTEPHLRNLLAGLISRENFTFLGNYSEI